MNAIYQKSLGINPATGLEDIIVVWQLTIDAQSSIVVIVYCIQTLDTKGGVIAISGNNTYTRYNKPDILFSKGDVITPAVLFAKDDIITPAVLADDGVTIVTPAVIADGSEVKVPAVIAEGTEVKTKGNMKFDLLKASSVGQMIVGMIKADIDSIKGRDTLTTDLAQN